MGSLQEVFRVLAQTRDDGTLASFRTGIQSEAMTLAAGARKVS